MARLLIVAPEVAFHTLLDAALAQAGYVAVEAANSYEGWPAADVAYRAAGRRPPRAPARARLLLVDAAAQFDTFFRDVLAQEGYVVTTAVHRTAGWPAANAAARASRQDFRYLVVY
jgi:DNA-binding response OmpR family regulator